MSGKILSRSFQSLCITVGTVIIYDNSKIERLFLKYKNRKPTWWTLVLRKWQAWFFIQYLFTPQFAIEWNQKLMNNNVSVLELRRLLYTIVDNRLDTNFRYRLLGEMWENNFLRVAEVTEKGVLLNDETNNTFKCVGDLSQIIQFEIDVAVHYFMPHNHYQVDLCEKSNPVSQCWIKTIFSSKF